MKKITVVVQSKDTKETLKSLRDLGVLHVEHQNVPVGDEVQRLKLEMMRVAQATAVLADTETQKHLRGNEQHIADEIVSALKEKKRIQDDMLKRQRHIDRWQEWGDFDPALIEYFKNKNLRVHLAVIPEKRKKEIPEDIVTQILFKKSSSLYCALISQRDIKVPFEVLELPKERLGSVLKKQNSDREKIKKIDEKIHIYAQYKRALNDYQERLESILQFQETLVGAGKSEMLSYVRGYIPYDSVVLLEEKSSHERWGLLIEEPDINDNVPTLIRNPRWVQIIKPVFDIIKALPGYKEVDISLWFLLFFSVFFGILIGDAGYGVIVLLLNLFLHRKLNKTLKDTRIFSLMYILSATAIIWGVLTGTFFGQAWLVQRIEPLMPSLNNSRNMQALCFFIGALHLSIAHLWKGLMKMPHLKSLSEIGWICMLWGAFFLARMLILSEVFPVFAKWLFIVGAGLIVLFSNPSRNVFKSVGLGFKDFLLNAVSSFTDVVSYIRLFAIGTATVAVADAFNQMAAGVGDGILGGVITVIILLLGHTLNIALGAMSILVHGLRLNVLEFSSHLGMEWSGSPYVPFKTKTQLTERK
ncbi:MAG: hypothetical protein ABH954_01450 [Candidatus Omnitrophota bacterium]